MAVGIAPNYTSQQLWEMYAWEDFHRDVLSGGKGLDKVIGVVSDTLDSANASIGHGFKHEEDYVTDLKIFSHLHDFLKHRYCYSEVNQKNVDILDKHKFEWNFVSNLLRGLKRIKNNEAPYLLSNEEKDITAGFISMLSQPPVDEDYWSVKRCCP